MSTINNYSSGEQNGGGNAKKGSAENPYTQEEFFSMLNAGNWPGGFVEGLGYCIKDVVVKPSSHTSHSSDSSDSSWDIWGSIGSFISDLFGSDENSNSSSDNSYSQQKDESTYDPRYPYPQINRTIKGFAFLYKLSEALGYRSGFNYIYSVRITGYRMYIGASISPVNITDREFWASVIVNHNGNERIYRLGYNPSGYITSGGYTAIGHCDIELPKSGRVSVTLVIGYNYDTGTGLTGDHKTFKIYP